MADERDKGAVTGALPTDALKHAGQQLLSLLVQRVTEAAAQRVSGLTDRLTDVTESGGNIRTALTGGSSQEREGATGETGDDTDRPGGLQGALGNLKEKVAGALGGGSGGGGGAKKLKMTNIVESLDIGLPLRSTYDLWTQFEDFPSFMKKVETVEQESDEKTNWTAKVWWSRRTWEATIVEQVPDSHIIWRSTGAKGHVDGAVTFTELGPNLTRVLLVMEYWPKGLFEQTGNLWRAQGRRARLEFKHFRRHAMTNVLLRQEEVEGWRGEIRDSEVVMTHEDAIEEEQQQQPSPGQTTDQGETPPDGTREDEYAEPEPSDDQSAMGEGGYDEDGAYDEDEGADEDAASDEGEVYDEDGSDEDGAYDEDEGSDEGEAYDEDEGSDEGEAYDEDEAYEDEDAEAEYEDAEAEDEDAEQADEDEVEAGQGEPAHAQSGGRG